jgi:hypothetical protein
MKRTISGMIVGILLGVGGMAVAGGKHPNINKAEKATKNAVAALDAAQKANEFDLGGHAANAKKALDTAETEIAAALADADKK